MKKTKGIRKRIKQLKSIAEIPEFKSEEEETEFWDTHSTAELAEKGLLEEVELKITGPLKKRIEEQRHKQLISLRLYPEQIEKTKEIAIQKGIGYLTLMRNWIQEGIERELGKKQDIINISHLEKLVLSRYEKSIIDFRENLERLFSHESSFTHLSNLLREHLEMPEKIPPITSSVTNPLIIMTKRRKTKIGIPLKQRWS